MTYNRYRAFALGLAILAGTSARSQTLWKEPPPVTLSDWTFGPGGSESAPEPPFTFLKEKMDGTNPKIEVRDPANRIWVVKFGSEVHSDTFAPRLLHVLGYAATPTYYVGEGNISEIRGLKRAKYFVSKTGAFRNARFKLHHDDAAGAAGPRNTTWSWVDNPFVGSHELGGLKILMMLTSNWDAKDSRDGDGESNNSTIGREWYAVTDWGASMGKTGGFFGRDRWDWIGYRAQTAAFVRSAPDGNPVFGFKGKHGPDIAAGIRIEDVRWLLTYLSRVTDEGLQAGLVASGASPAVAQEFTSCIRARIGQLQRVADSSTVERASK
jgi:hypothetical protein